MGLHSFVPSFVPSFLSAFLPFSRLAYQRLLLGRGPPRRAPEARVAARILQGARQHRAAPQTRSATQRKARQHAREPRNGRRKASNAQSNPRPREGRKDASQQRPCNTGGWRTRNARRKGRERNQRENGRRILPPRQPLSSPACLPARLPACPCSACLHAHTLHAHALPCLDCLRMHAFVCIPCRTSVRMGIWCLRWRRSQILTRQSSLKVASRCAEKGSNSTPHTAYACTHMHMHACTASQARRGKARQTKERRAGEEGKREAV